jgi:hypothetical protein
MDVCGCKLTVALAASIVLCEPAPLSSSAEQSSSRRPQASVQSNARGEATKAFLDRIREYVTFHNNVAKMVPALNETNDPEKISAREKALGEALIKQRPNAKPGDFLITQYQPILRLIIKEDFAKRPVADRKALIQELPKKMKIEVNMVYPTTIPLVTFPANLLKQLPELPPELEYRIVGRDLLLRDTKGNVIVDIMRDVFPIPS